MHRRVARDTRARSRPQRLYLLIGHDAGCSARARPGASVPSLASTSPAPRTSNSASSAHGPSRPIRRATLPAARRQRTSTRRPSRPIRRPLHTITPRRPQRRSCVSPRRAPSTARSQPGERRPPANRGIQHDGRRRRSKSTIRPHVPPPLEAHTQATDLTRPSAAGEGKGAIHRRHSRSGTTPHSLRRRFDAARQDPPDFSAPNHRSSPQAPSDSVRERASALVVHRGASVRHDFSPGRQCYSPDRTGSAIPRLRFVPVRRPTASRTALIRNRVKTDGSRFIPHCSAGCSRGPPTQR